MTTTTEKFNQIVTDIEAGTSRTWTTRQDLPAVTLYRNLDGTWTMVHLDTFQGSQFRMTEIASMVRASGLLESELLHHGCKA